MVINPTPDQIIQARRAAGLSQTAAAAVIHKQLRIWQYYETGERVMRPELWELFLIKTANANL